MTPSAKYSLINKERKKFAIQPQAEAYIFMWDFIDKDQCKQIEQFLLNDHFQIVNKNLQANPSAGDKYDYAIVAFREN
jgi:hypothetical protein